MGDVRGLGAMCAIEIVKNKKTKEPDPKMTKRILKRAYENGLLILHAGMYSNVIRTLMPLVITDSQLKKALDIIDDSVLAEGKE